MSLERRVSEHYTHGDLPAAVLAALAKAGKDVERLTLEDLAPIDEFHVRGREATLELGEGLGLRADMEVLDVGGGLGGPARTLAASYGCRVVSIDLTEAYCRVAAMLAARVGLAGRVAACRANALSLPFADVTFDAVYSQHAAMNIADKARLYREIARVLKPGGGFGLYDILQGPDGAPHYPAPWARNAETSFLIAPEDLRRELGEAGLSVVGWRETTAEGRAWFDEMRRGMAEEGPPTLGFHLLLGPAFAEMARNQARNLAEDRIRLIEAICRRG